jgi:hypothetical protein
VLLEDLDCRVQRYKRALKEKNVVNKLKIVIKRHVPFDSEKEEELDELLEFIETSLGLNSCILSGDKTPTTFVRNVLSSIAKSTSITRLKIDSVSQIPVSRESTQTTNRV